MQDKKIAFYFQFYSVRINFILGDESRKGVSERIVEFLRFWQDILESDILGSDILGSESSARVATVTLYSDPAYSTSSASMKNIIAGGARSLNSQADKNL